MTTALIIEDNEDNTELIRLILNHHGYQTIVAETGLKGVEMALEHSPDFILLDINLPDIQGPEVLRQIRDNERDQTVPIIAVTSHAMVGDRERLIAQGLTGYIEKPIDPLNVVTQIKDIIGASH